MLLVKLFPTLMDIARVNLDELLSVRGAVGSLCTVNAWMAWIILPMTGAARAHSSDGSGKWSGIEPFTRLICFL